MGTSAFLLSEQNSTTTVNMHTFGSHKATEWKSYKEYCCTCKKNYFIYEILVSIFIFHDFKTNLLLILDLTTTNKGNR